MTKVQNPFNNSEFKIQNVQYKIQNAILARMHQARTNFDFGDS